MAAGPRTRPLLRSPRKLSTARYVPQATASLNALRDPTRFNLRYETPWFGELLLANLLSPVGATPPNTPPFVVGNDTMVVNLNAELLSGLDAASFWKLLGNGAPTSAIWPRRVCNWPESACM